MNYTAFEESIFNLITESNNISLLITQQLDVIIATNFFLLWFFFFIYLNDKWKK